MFEIFKNIFQKEKPKSDSNKVTKQRKPRAKKKEPILSEKEKTTLANEPYISILKVDVDPNNINAGSFELDWNDKFVLNLVRAGYKIKDTDTDQEIVDRWFQTVCRNIALEFYEQQQADLTNKTNTDLRQVVTKDLGNGRKEIS